MAIAQAGVPSIIASSVICLGLGAVAGVGGMGLFGYKLKAPDLAKGSPPAAMMGMMGGGGGKMGMMMGKKGGGGPKSQLENLIVKLDVLTQRPLKIELSKEQANKVAAEVSELAGADLTDEDAKKHLDSLLETLKDQKETLVAAGFRWPTEQGAGLKRPFGMGGGAPPVDLPKHLKALEQRLGKTVTN